MDFYSHPDKLLKYHLYEVSELAGKMFQNSRKRSDQQPLIRLAYLIGLSHDFGKYTTFFQNHLNGKKSSNNLHHHAFISAIFAVYLTNELPIVGEQSRYYPLIAYMTVMHHHGQLRRADRDIFDPEALHFENHQLYSRYFIATQQMPDLLQNASVIEEEYAHLFKKHNINFMLSLNDFSLKWRDTFQKLHKDYYLFSKLRRRQESAAINIYILVLNLFSVLIDADKHSAAGISISKRHDIPENLVARYKEYKFSNQKNTFINKWRSEMNNYVMRKAAAYQEANLYSLTAPTGAGKTLMAFELALSMRTQMEANNQMPPKIIYSLPFTSVIDQNYEVFAKVLEQMEDYELRSSEYLIKHHHLTPPKYIGGHNESIETPLNEALLLIESWESEIVVTTFVQLLETFLGYRNRTLKKYHHLTNSIIILDEVQNIPVEYWRLIENVFVNFLSRYNCKIILMTATQPAIFSNNYKPVELLSDETQGRKYFREMERVEINLVKKDDKGFEVDSWIEYFYEHFEDGKNYLAIFNTLRTSIDIYKNVKKLFGNTSYSIIYLSTNIAPIERKRRIQDINIGLKTGRKLIVVATQVIEAGADVDFDVVYRDIGPIDAIVQSAGRCNRNASQDMGKVIITPMVRGNQYESTLVYGAIHTSASLKLMPTCPTKESEMFEIVEKYFNEINTRRSSDESKNIWEAALALKYSDYGEKVKGSSGESFVSDFELIKDQNSGVNVFIEYTDEASFIWDQFKKSVLEEKDGMKRWEANNLIKQRLKNYTVSSPINLVSGLDPALSQFEKTGLLYVPAYLVDQYYNNEYGLIRSEMERDAWVF